MILHDDGSGGSHATRDGLLLLALGIGQDRHLPVVGFTLIPQGRL